MAELAEQFDVYVNQISTWRDQLLKGATDVFGGPEKSEAAAPDIRRHSPLNAVGPPRCERLRLIKSGS